MEWDPPFSDGIVQSIISFNSGSHNTFEAKVHGRRQPDCGYPLRRSLYEKPKTTESE